MSKLNQILAALGDELSTHTQKSELSSNQILEKLPFRSLSGDHINGGKVHNFASSGITDKATKPQLNLSDQGVSIQTFSQGFTVNGNIQGEDAKFKVLKADVIEAVNIIGEIKFEKDVPIVFSGDSIDGKGLLWSGKGHTKQFVFHLDPDRFFVSEHIDLAKGKSITINNIKIIDEKELGPTITKSNLREVGHLKGLIVDGGLSVGQFMVFDVNTSRLGLGTDSPNSAFSIVDDGVELVLGAKDTVKAFVGTFAAHDLELGTNNTASISLLAGGNIVIGNPNSGYNKVSIMALVGVNTQTPDQRSALHVNGALKFNDKLHFSADAAPTMNSYTKGDICWNDNPQAGKHVGWVCVQSGNPGIWNGFGRIE
jgi:hypothetical protein